MFIELTRQGGEDLLRVNINHIVVVFGGSEDGTTIRLSTPSQHGLYDIKVDNLAGEVFELIDRAIR